MTQELKQIFDNRYGENKGLGYALHGVFEEIEGWIKIVHDLKERVQSLEETCRILQTNNKSIGSHVVALEADNLRLNGNINNAVSRINALDKPTSGFEVEEICAAITNSINPAPIQSSEIRIRPEDMVMVKYSDEEKPRTSKFQNVNYFSEKLDYISPIQPVRREWMVIPHENDKVWAITNDGEVTKTKFDNLGHGAQFIPVLSPDEPAPEAPSEVG